MKAPAKAPQLEKASKNHTAAQESVERTTPLSSYKRPSVEADWNGPVHVHRSRDRAERRILMLDRNQHRGAQSELLGETQMLCIARSASTFTPSPEWVEDDFGFDGGG